MFGYTLRRLLWLIPVLTAVGLTTFVVMHAAPGGPFDKDPNRRQLSAAAQAKLNENFGLDKPYWQQFVAYMFGDFKDEKNKQGKLVINKETGKPNRVFACGAMCLNFGPTYSSRGARTVEETLFAAQGKKPALFYYTARLAVQALVVALLLGIPLGTIAALKQNTVVDYLSLFFSTLFVAIPSLIIGLFMVIIFGRVLGWVQVIPKPDDFLNRIGPWVLPTLVLGLAAAAGITRYTRASVLEVMRQDYVRTARAKGIAESTVVLRHILRNSLIPVVTIIFPLLAGLLTGSFFTEQIFQVPGIGRAFVTAIGARDYSMIMGTALIYAFLIAFANLAVDLAYGVLDPRIKVGK